MEKTSGTKKILSFFFRFSRVIIVLVIAVAVARLLITLKNKPEKRVIAKTPPSVKVLAAIPVSKVMTVDAYGTVKPRREVKIASEVPGRIDYIHPFFIEGGLIKKGELLARIDQRSYLLDRQAGDVRIRQAKTDIENLKQTIQNLKNDIALSRANVTLTRKERKRIKTLNQNQFASKNSLDKAEQQYLQAKIALQNIHNRLVLTDTLMEQKNIALAMARVELQKADLRLIKTRITAPFDGFVLDKFAEAGEYINPGQTIGSMYQKDALDVDVRIPMEKIKWIGSFFEKGDMPNAKVTAVNFDSIRPFVWDARVVRVKAKIDEKTRTLPMTLEIVKPEHKIKKIFDLKPGAFVKCSIEGETYENIFVVPRYLLRQGKLLFIAKDNHLKMKKVTILRKFEEQIYINGGLSPKDKIISSPLPGAFDGMALTIIPLVGNKP